MGLIGKLLLNLQCLGRTTSKGINEFVDLVKELKSVAEHGAGDLGKGSQQKSLTIS